LMTAIDFHPRFLFQVQWGVPVIGLAPLVFRSL